MEKIVYKVCIITHTHLSRNPRVLKEALALIEAGYEVYLLNSVYSKVLVAADLALLNGFPIYIEHISDLSKNDFRSFFDRALKKVGNLLIKYFKWETCYALGYAPQRYISISKKIKADLYICHQELPLYVGANLVKSGLNVAFDIEDWHAEDLLREAVLLRPIKLLRHLEAFALENGRYSTTTSEALAKQLSIRYHVQQPNVIYNSFQVDQQILQIEKQIKLPIKLVWYSLNIGKGRGLEEFIEILNRLNVNVELHLIGEIEPLYKREIQKLIDRGFDVFFYPPVPTTQMEKTLSKFDVGLAIELHQPKNREFTITNKFFQYVQSGLPIIATNTVGQQEVFKLFNPGILIDFNKPDEAALAKWLNNPHAIKNAKANSHKMANAYDWKTQKINLLNLVKYALS
ncbi:glycosyltransferase [Pedobacter frigidisoli]|uniref:glycosyltransferase n=1 Tax=Pedobacter frigidisoli TaxID=2530455 RepID=UPI0029303BFD|nr:glycosyltransferase [Pedobacter frigidisoli]